MWDTGSDRSERRTASPETCGDGGSDRGPRTDASGGRSLAEAPALEASLPDDVQTLLGRLLGEDPIETLGAWATEVRRRTGGGPIAVEDLCRTDAETPHRGQIGDDTYYFRCFYDAVILAALVDEPVDVRTQSPDGAVVEATATGTGHLRVAPAEAVFSFGIDEAVDPPTDDGPSRAAVYAAVCPYVRAFPDPAAYRRWAHRVPAATVALPPQGATDLAAGLVE